MFTPADQTARPLVRLDTRNPLSFASQPVRRPRRSADWYRAWFAGAFTRPSAERSRGTGAVVLLVPGATRLPFGLGVR